MAIGTARMASLCLPNSELHVGVAWRPPALAARAPDPARPAALLYPSEAPWTSHRSTAGPVTLVVVDGTWWQARKLVRENPVLAALPRYAFARRAERVPHPRASPRDDYVSTIEALRGARGARGRPRAFRGAARALSRHGRQAAQLCRERLRMSRGRHSKAAPTAASRAHRPCLPPELSAANLVCVDGRVQRLPP